MQYKIGDVARILGISTDLLRYYEKKGVVTPVKDKYNDYRYYETWDINFLLDCLWYKEFGFSISQIAHMVTECPHDRLVASLEQKEDELEQSLRRQQMLLRRLRQHRESVARIKEHLGTCELCNSPEVVGYLNRYNFIYDNSSELQAVSRKWLEHMPFIQRFFVIPQEVLNTGGGDYAWGFSLTMDYVREFQVPLEPPVIHFPAQRCLYSAFKSSGKNGFTPQHLDFIKEYAREHGLTLSGGARGNLVCSVFEDNATTGYFEVWLPVAADDPA